MLQRSLMSSSLCSRPLLVLSTADSLLQSHPAVYCVWTTFPRSPSCASATSTVSPCWTMFYNKVYVTIASYFVLSICNVSTLHGQVGPRKGYTEARPDNLRSYVTLANLVKVKVKGFCCAKRPELADQLIFASYMGPSQWLRFRVLRNGLELAVK